MSAGEGDVADVWSGDVEEEGGDYCGKGDVVEVSASALEAYGKDDCLECEFAVDGGGEYVAAVQGA